MAGQPLRRAREKAASEAEGVPGGRAKAVDVATRVRVVARAVEVGTARAAEEYGVKPATVRSWRRRVKSEPVGEVAAPVFSLSAGVPGVVDDDAVGQMRETVTRARQIASDAARQSGDLLREGKSVAVRELAASAKLWSATCLSLEQALAIAAASDKRLEPARAKLMADVVVAFMLEVLGVAAVGTATGAALGELLRRAEAGDSLAMEPGKVDAARGEVVARVLGQLDREANPLGKDQHGGSSVAGDPPDVAGGGDGTGGVLSPAGATPDVAAEAASPTGAVSVDGAVGGGDVEDVPPLEEVDGVIVDEKGIRWREAFVDRDGVRHGRSPIVGRVTSTPVERPASSWSGSERRGVR